MLKRVLGSLVATSSGWIVGWMAFLFMSRYINGSVNRWTWDDMKFSLAALLNMGIFIVPLWLAVLVPLYILVPRTSIIWNPCISVPLGVMAGFVLMQSWIVYQGLTDFNTFVRRAFDIDWWLDIPAATVGGVTCFIGTLTYGTFNAGSDTKQRFSETPSL